MKNINTSEICTVTKYELYGVKNKKKTNVVNIKGRFVKIYENFLLFEDLNGCRECFTKRTHEIDWSVIH